MVRDARKGALLTMRMNQMKDACMTRSIDGRCAVVTGGAQGFGRAIAERSQPPAPKSRSGITTSARGKDRQEIGKEIGSP